MYAQSYPVLYNPVDYSLPDSSVHGGFLGKNTCFLLQRIFPTQESNLHFLYLLHCGQILYPLSHQESLIK